MSHAFTQVTSKRAANVATPLDILFVLAAVVVGAFGWGSAAGPPLALFIVAAALVLLFLEEIVRLSVHRVVSVAWLCTITKVDMLILLGALVVNELFAASLGIISIGTIIVWLLVEAILWLRGHRITIDGWYHRAALLISLVAVEVSVEASTIWLSSAYGGPPSPFTHVGFHQVLDGGITISFALLLLFLAWFPLRQKQGYAVVALVGAVLPAAVTAGWAASLAMANHRDYGYVHSYAWLLTVLWVISVACAVRGFFLQKSASSAESLSTAENVSEKVLIYGAILVLTFLTILGVLLDIFAVMVLLLWLGSIVLFWLTRQPTKAPHWFLWATILASAMVSESATETSKVWLYSGAYGGAPSPLDHVGFHHVLDGGIGISFVLLLLFLAWGRPGLNWVNLRREHGWLVAGLLVTALPAAVIGGWAAYVALSQQRDYGVVHAFAWLLPLFWVCSLLSIIRGFAFKQRVPPMSIVEAAKEDD